MSCYRLPRDESIVGVWCTGGDVIAATATTVYYVGGLRLLHRLHGRFVGMALPGRLLHPIPPAAVYIDKARRMHFVTPDADLIDRSAPPEQVACTTDGRILSKFGGSLYETSLVRVGGVVANCAVYATTLFDGLAVQTMLGTTLLTRFHSPGCSETIAVPELNGYRVVSARGAGSVAVLVAVRGGVAERFILRFTPGGAYDVHQTIVDETFDPNFAVTPRDILVLVGDEGRLELVAAKPERGKWTARVVEDPAVDPSWRLFVPDDGVGVWKGPCVWRLKLK